MVIANGSLLWPLQRNQSFSIAKLLHKIPIGRLCNVVGRYWPLFEFFTYQIRGYRPAVNNAGKELVGQSRNSTGDVLQQYFPNLF